LQMELVWHSAHHHESIELIQAAHLVNNLLSPPLACLKACCKAKGLWRWGCWVRTMCNRAGGSIWAKLGFKGTLKTQPQGITATLKTLPSIQLNLGPFPPHAVIRYCASDIPLVHVPDRISSRVSCVLKTTTACTGTLNKKEVACLGDGRCN
jgi:hypothetical protein